MANNETAHELILQILKTRMTFRQTIQRVLRTNNVDMTFEMLQVMHRLWKKPGVSQQYLEEQTVKEMGRAWGRERGEIGWVAVH